MPSSWIEEKPKSDEFLSFLEIYQAFLDGKTSDPVRLRFRVQKIWDSYDISKKKDFTDRLVMAGAVKEMIPEVVRSFGGIITTLA